MRVHSTVRGCGVASRSLGIAAISAAAYCVVLGSGGCAGTADAARPGPADPVDVRVTDLPSDLVDAIADRVADRVVARIESSRSGASPAAVPVARGGSARPGQVAGPATAPATSAPRRVASYLPPPPAPAATDADLRAAGACGVAAIDWLARHQGDDGLWSAARHGGEASYDVGVTGLALVAMLGAGETMETGEHAANVKRGLKRLLEHQDAEGCIGPRTSSHFMYNHAYAALALCEAYGVTQSPVLRVPAQRAADFILRARNPYLGWRYGIRDGDNDTSTTGLMVMVLRSAQLAGLEVDPQAFTGALAWFDKMTEPEYGRTGYQQRGGPSPRTMETVTRFPADRVESTTAIAVAARLFAGADRESDEWVRKGGDLVASKPPVWDEATGSIDFLYWYWGTLAQSQRGGASWASWRDHVVRALPAHQRRETGADEVGSWDPVDPWSTEGGRVYSTAMGCLISQMVGGTHTIVRAGPQRK